MSQTDNLAGRVHDAIDDVATAVEGIHKSVADFPLDLLSEITPFKRTLAEVKATQDEAIAAAYGIVRRINLRIRQITTAAADRC